MQNTLILCKNGQNRYPTLPKCPFWHKNLINFSQICGAAGQT